MTLLDYTPIENDKDNVELQVEDVSDYRVHETISLTSLNRSYVSRDERGWKPCVLCLGRICISVCHVFPGAVRNTGYAQDQCEWLPDGMLDISFLRK